MIEVVLIMYRLRLEEKKKNEKETRVCIESKSFNINQCHLLLKTFTTYLGFTSYAVKRNIDFSPRITNLIKDTLFVSSIRIEANRIHLLRPHVEFFMLKASIVIAQFCYMCNLLISSSISSLYRP